MERADIIRDALAAVGEFNGRRLWKRFTNSDCFGVRIAAPICPEPKRADEPMLGVVLGNAGEEYGLSLFRGADAVASFVALLDSDGPMDDVLNDMDMLGFTMEAFGRLLPEDQRRMRQAGQHPRYDEQVPHFLAKPPGCRARFPREAELQLLLLVLRAVVEADQKKRLQPTRLGAKGGICVVAISADAAAPQVAVTREHWQSAAGAAQPVPEGPRRGPVLSESLELRGLPRLDATWLVGLPTVPAGVQGDDRVMQVLLVVDEADEYVLQGRPVLGGDLPQAVSIFVETFRGGGLDRRKGLPHRIIFSSRKLRDAVAPALEPAGIECVYEPVIPQLQRIVADLVAHFARGPYSLGKGREVPDMPEAKIPAPADLKGWKAADLELARRFAEYFEFGKQLHSSRVVKRYFGDDDLQSHLQDHKERAVVPAYTAWGILDYRANKNSKTQAEKMLAEGLPQPEAILLRARMEACPSLYRVTDHDAKAGTIELEDVLLGGIVTVCDQMMSENIENGLFFAARTFPVGQFHFVELAGPPLGPGMGREAVDFLRECGMEFTPQGLRRDAHMFGWLWKWVDQWRVSRKALRLHNTDGEEFLWHTASFSMADPVQIRQILKQRKDLEYDEQADEFVWSKKTGRDNRMLGETVTLGRIELVGDELVITVNSAQRFAVARQWLQELPGVAFRDVTTRCWNEAEKDRPLDERIAPAERVEVPPEMAAGIQERMDRYYLEWLDVPLPLLGGRTPRQACQTEVGRQQVTMLIRTMPDPMGRASVLAPREAMLRELGLTTETPTAPPTDQPMPRAPIPVESIPPKPKVARNAPCPCGSGRKYKKCCGRES